MEILEKLYEKHKVWCEIVESFGCNPDTAQDIVSEMYLKIAKLVEKGTDISYGDGVNYFYIFRTLTSIFLDYKRKESKTGLIGLDEMEMQFEDDEEVPYQKKYDKILEGLAELYWYDRKVFEIIENGESISELSRKTNISYYSLYNTYKKVKKYLKDKL
jgi:DNA-directed RNA polymerase specialized sigma24 family protein